MLVLKSGCYVEAAYVHSLALLTSIAVVRLVETIDGRRGITKGCVLDLSAELFGIFAIMRHGKVHSLNGGSR